MRLSLGAAALMLGLFFQFGEPTQVQAQVITTGPDSTVVPTVPAATTEEEDSRFFLSRWDKPAKAAFYSAVFPGLGQAYNKAYWKVPIVLATGGVLGYFLIDNNNKYQEFREALIQRNLKVEDAYLNHPTFGVGNPNGARNLRTYRDFWRRNRDLTVLLSIGAYGLQVAEAYVHAHMKEFSVSDDLALRVQPNLLHVPSSTATTMAPGLTLTLYTRGK